MKPPKRAFKTNPVSKTGIVYIASGIILFLSGTTRGELVSAICGCALVLYAMFCFICAAIGAWRWKNARFSFSWEGKDIAVLKLTETTRMPGRAVLFATAFFESTFRVRPETDYVLPFNLSIPVSEPEIRHRIDIPPRGIYHSDRTAIVIKDYSGFFRFPIFMPQSMNPESLHVLPETGEPASVPLPPGKTGVSQGKSTFNRSDELYETRPYMPGDDPRKINWKVFAHSGTPVLREGELLPPPSTEYLFVFNTEIRDRRSNRAAVKRDFDALVSRAAFIARSLAGQNKIISVARLSLRGETDITTIRPDDPDSRAALLMAFAELQPRQAELDLRPESGASGIFDSNAALLFFTIPENAENTVLEALSKSNSLIVCGPAPTSAREKNKLQSILGRFSSGGFNVAQI